MTEFDGLPVLRSPVAIAAFEGWNDAADASTAAVEHLEQVWHAAADRRARPGGVLRLPGQPARPSRMADGETRRIEWPTTRFTVASPPGHRPRRGADPGHRAEHALAHVLRAGAGGLPQPRGGHGWCCSARCWPTCRTPGRCRSAAAPPTRRPPSATSSPRPGTTGRPASSACCTTRAAGPSWTRVSFWVHVPHYANNPPCPKATLALLHRVEEVLDLPVPMADLAEEAAEWEQRVRARRRAGRRARRVRARAGGTGRRRGHHAADRRRDRPGVREVPAPPGRLGRPDRRLLVAATPSYGLERCRPRSSGESALAAGPAPVRGPFAVARPRRVRGGAVTPAGAS